jgi:dipeptidase E
LGSRRRSSTGFDAAELDLRGYFDDGNRLRRDLAGFAVTWLRGGNVLMLRYALRRSGGDAVFRDLLADEALVYAGYSAGACVLSPSLRGFEAVDDADAVARIYGAEPIWDGLALLGKAFVPHYRSSDHPETAAIEHWSRDIKPKEPHTAHCAMDKRSSSTVLTPESCNLARIPRGR